MCLCISLAKKGQEETQVHKPVKNAGTILEMASLYLFFLLQKAERLNPQITQRDIL